MDKNELELLVELSGCYEQGDCPRCGGELRKDMVKNSLSRYADVYICSSCGVDEAMRDIIGKVLPYEEWHIVELVE